jgi:hypothetical protein
MLKTSTYFFGPVLWNLRSNDNKILQLSNKLMQWIQFVPYLFEHTAFLAFFCITLFKIHFDPYLFCLILANKRSMNANLLLMQKWSTDCPFWVYKGKFYLHFDTWKPMITKYCISVVNMQSKHVIPFLFIHSLIWQNLSK